MTKKLSLIFGSIFFAIVLAGCSSTAPTTTVAPEDTEVVEEVVTEDEMMEEEVLEEDAMMEEEYPEDDSAMEEEAQVVEDEL
jgi:PBP1b-binding outer membrane lipoprotein LpoB